MEDLNIQYNLTETIETVTLKLYDNQGRLVKTMEQLEQEAGFYQVRWNLSDLQAGMYHVCLELNGKCTKMERVIMLK
jgi:flagellar hook assembly protein FlgD